LRLKRQLQTVEEENKLCAPAPAQRAAQRWTDTRVDPACAGSARACLRRRKMPRRPPWADSTALERRRAPRSSTRRRLCVPTATAVRAVNPGW